MTSHIVLSIDNKTVYDNLIPTSQNTTNIINSSTSNPPPAPIGLTDKNIIIGQTYFLKGTDKKFTVKLIKPAGFGHGSSSTTYYYNRPDVFGSMVSADQLSLTGLNGQTAGNPIKKSLNRIKKSIKNKLKYKKFRRTNKKFRRTIHKGVNSIVNNM